MVVIANEELILGVAKTLVVLIPLAIIGYYVRRAVLGSSNKLEKKDLIPVPPAHPQAEKLCEEFHSATAWEKIPLTEDGENYLYTCHVCQKFRSKS